MTSLSRKQHYQHLGKSSRTPEALSIAEMVLRGTSWALVMAIGLMPLAEKAFGSPISMVTPTAITFVIAVGSALLLRRKYSWVGLILHIYGQITIWLSIFVMSLTVAPLLAGRT